MNFSKTKNATTGIAMAMLLGTSAQAATLQVAPNLVVPLETSNVEPVSSTTELELKTDQERAVYQLIEDLIQAGTTFDTSELERIYHDDMKVVMIDLENNVAKADKAGFVSLFENLKASGKEPLNTWAKYNVLEVAGDTANVLITRRVNLTGADQILVLSIDLIHEDNRWQVTRETIFARPDDQS